MRVLLLAVALITQPVTIGGLPVEEETRAQDLMREMRCMVCSGESILDSDAPMAQDMRRYVREQVAQGVDDEQVRQALVERFGHEVLLRPPMTGPAIILWMAPMLFLTFGGMLLFVSMGKRSTKL